MSPRKTVIIGAGSASFGPATLASIMRQPALHGNQLALVDLNEQSLQDMTRVAQRMNQAWNAHMNISAAVDRRQVLEGADFVVISIEVPPREALWRLDWEITTRHGLRQPYGENGGPGGLMHALRQIPPFMEIVRDMEALCPDAWLINFSNPLPRINRAVSRYSTIKTVGKCHQLDVGYGIAAVLLSDLYDYDVPQGVDLHSDPANAPFIQRMAHLGRQHLAITAAGLNHFTWMLDVRDRESGEDLYPALRRRINRAPDGFEPLTLELFDIFGCCPVPGDSHLCEYLPWTHDPLGKPWEYYRLRLYNWEGNEAYRDFSLDMVRRMAEGSMSIQGLRDIPSEGAAEIISAIINNNRYYDDAANIPNEGAIPNLADETIVELPAVIDGMGVHGISLPPLPEPIAELCRREAALVERVVEAAVSGSRELALQALLLDPMINDIRRARAILNDYLETFSDQLPQFRQPE